MNDYEILKQEEIVCDNLWRENSKDKIAYGLQAKELRHLHLCDFAICNFMICKNRKQLDKLVKKKCEKYLLSIGKVRDEYMSCCDSCIHDRYLTLSGNIDDLILNISTLGLDRRWGVDSENS